ncbi:hypothetical protein GCK72_002189 [Caenorhabditis remanei]|uniref:Uncharacterized protein n=1 Tax=Caenorhabditis remanei TaxID=31234 RepID=A0A6A5HT79_CAERE|nr:hypothetical protein GCK72_002189 [Caenorhabditis remanei]KAF1770371.1 hypothetical protein GCK72_002189 [Caenorhabditis remanei]
MNWLEALVGELQQQTRLSNTGIPDDNVLEKRLIDLVKIEIGRLHLSIHVQHHLSSENKGLSGVEVSPSPVEVVSACFGVLTTGGFKEAVGIEEAVVDAVVGGSPKFKVRAGAGAADVAPNKLPVGAAEEVAVDVVAGVAPKLPVVPDGAIDGAAAEVVPNNPPEDGAEVVVVVEGLVPKSPPVDGRVEADAVDTAVAPNKFPAEAGTGAVVDEVPKTVVAAGTFVWVVELNSPPVELVRVLAFPPKSPPVVETVAAAAAGEANIPVDGAVVVVAGVVEANIAAGLAALLVPNRPTPGAAGAGAVLPKSPLAGGAAGEVEVAVPKMFPPLVCTVEEDPKRPVFDVAGAVLVAAPNMLLAGAAGVDVLPNKPDVTVPVEEPNNPGFNDVDVVVLPKRLLDGAADVLADCPKSPPVAGAEVAVFPAPNRFAVGAVAPKRPVLGVALLTEEPKTFVLAGAAEVLFPKRPVVAGACVDVPPNGLAFPPEVVVLAPNILFTEKLKMDAKLVENSFTCVSCCITE